MRAAEAHFDEEGQLLDAEATFNKAFREKNRGRSGLDQLDARLKDQNQGKKE